MKLKMTKNNNDDTEIVKSRSSRFSRAKVEADMGELGPSMAGYESVVLASEFSRPGQTFSPSLEAFLRGLREKSLAPSLHRASTDALIDAGIKLWLQVDVGYQLFKCAVRTSESAHTLDAQNEMT